LEGKKRPALLLLDTGDDDIIVARVTSQIYQSFYDIKIVEWEKAGLIKPGIVRLHKIATLEKKMIEKSLGFLSPEDLTKIRSKLHEMFSV